MRYRVKHNCVLLYGSCNKVSITLNVGQIWEYKAETSELFPFHTLKRSNVLIEIANDDFESIFEPQESEEKPKSEWQHDHEILKACSDGASAVLDKIRAEIEELAKPNEFGGRGNGKSVRYGLCKALEIIDKYKAESEIHCTWTDSEIAKSFIEDVEAVKDLLPRAEGSGKE